MRGTLLTIVESRRLAGRLGEQVEGLRLSVNGQLILQVVEDVVGWGGQAASVGKGQVGSDEEVGQVISGDIAGDRLVVAGRAGVFEDGFVVARVDRDGLEGGGTEVGVGCVEVRDVRVGFGAGGDAGKIKGSGGIVVATDCDDSAGSEGGGREHVVVWWRWRA